MKYAFGFIILLVSLSACERSEVSSEELKKYFNYHKVGTSSDYAIVKNGTDYLATIHGMVDDKSVCEELITGYNQNASLSVFPGSYTCVQLNQ